MPWVGERDITIPVDNRPRWGSPRRPSEQARPARIPVTNCGYWANIQRRLVRLRGESLGLHLLYRLGHGDDPLCTFHMQVLDQLAVDDDNAFAACACR